MIIFSIGGIAMIMTPADSLSLLGKKEENGTNKEVGPLMKDNV